jgi:hypothetical protein
MQHPSTDLSNATTLEEVHEHFQQWRKEKPAHNSHIPDYLWDQVARIVEHYRQSDILKHLKITRHQLVGAMKYQQPPQGMDSTVASISQEIPNKVTPDPFIKVSMPMILDPESQLTSQQPHTISSTPPKEQRFPKVELIHPNGVTMRITGIADQALSHLMSSFMGMA